MNISEATEHNKEKDLKKFVTMKIGAQDFGISVDFVVDVLFPQHVTPIPLVRQEIIGSLNLRGRIVTALDIRSLMEINKPLDPSHAMCVVVEHEDELFSLVVDEVGDVVSFSMDEMVENPDNLSPVWQEMSLGILPLKEELLVILDINKIMSALMK